MDFIKLIGKNKVNFEERFLFLLHKGANWLFPDRYKSGLSDVHVGKIKIKWEDKKEGLVVFHEPSDHGQK